MLNERGAFSNGYTLKSTTECNGEIFEFLLNESKLMRDYEVEQQLQRWKLTHHTRIAALCCIDIP